MLLHEKADQAQKLLRETALDCWLTFVRETDLHPDPGIELVVGVGAVRNSGFLFGGGRADRGARLRVSFELNRELTVI